MENQTQKGQIDIDETFTDSQYTDGKRIWKTIRLIEHARQQGYKEFDFPIKALRTSYNPWRDQMDSFKEVLSHLKRVRDADLSYPILLDDFGDVCNGYHRIAKAVMEGKEFIKAIRLETMPEHDSVEPHEKNKNN